MSAVVVFFSFVTWCQCIHIPISRKAKAYNTKILMCKFGFCKWFCYTDTSSTALGSRSLCEAEIERGKRSHPMDSIQAAETRLLCPRSRPLISHTKFWKLAPFTYDFSLKRYSFHIPFPEKVPHSNTFSWKETPFPIFQPEKGTPFPHLGLKKVPLLDGAWSRIVREKPQGMWTQNC